MPASCESAPRAIPVVQVAAILLLVPIAGSPAAARAPDAEPLGFGQFSPPVAVPAPEAPLPGNLIVPDIIRPLVTTMWHRSVTFRRQCSRLAEHPDVIVHVELEVGVQDARARSRVERHGVGRTAAVQIEWRTPARYAEYIAHELEHVMEQLDGIDLPRLARLGVDGVVLQGREYETLRAQSVGRTVAREVMQ
jgi:hypothetical protein